MVASLREKHIVIALCVPEKKHRQFFDKLRVCTTEINARNKCDGGRGISFSFVKMHYDEKRDEVLTDTWEDVDVVLHKVSALHPKTAGALKRWCTAASWSRRRKHLPPVVVVDPVDVTRVVLRRSLVCELLSSRLKQPFCPMPRSWLWTRGDEALTPLGPFSSSPRTEERDASLGVRADPPGERWWIVKPDLSSGPAFTHHMVIWRGAHPESAPPKEVQQLLPPEANEFVVQEFLFSAIPVVIKVYCIGTYVFVKAVSETPLMRHILSGAGAPVMMDSQKKFENDAEWEKEVVQWKKFLAEGGRMHAHCSQIAAQLTEELGLTLFGFDLLLVPEHLCSRGAILPDASAGPPEELITTSPYSHAPLFDEVRDSPTRLLCSAIPVLVDVNYFPGFSGVEKLGERLLELIESRVMNEPLF